jgi:hypothetical protein
MFTVNYQKIQLMFTVHYHKIQQSPPGSEEPMKKIKRGTYVYNKGMPSYVDSYQSTKGSKPKALRKASNFSLGRAFVKRSAMFSCVGTYAKLISLVENLSLT